MNRAVHWPPSWSPRRRRDWQSRGGTPRLAAAFWDAGWDAPAVLAATYSIQRVADLRPPTAPAWVHEALGDDLGDLLRDGAPALSEDPELVCSRTGADGNREIYEVEHDGGKFVVRRHSHEAGNWRSETLDGQHTDLVRAVQATAEIRQVGGGVIVRMFVNLEQDARRLVGHLEVTGPMHANRWPKTLADEWLESDHELAEDLPETNWFPVWGRVTWLPENGEQSSYRLSAVRLPEGAQPLAVPVLVDGLPRIMGVETLAEFASFLESGGAPISWDDRYRLLRLSDHHVAASQSGDLGSEFDAWAVEAGESTESVIADWVVRHGLDAIAAVHLEPLDPRRMLKGEDARRWQELLAAAREQTSFAVHRDWREAVRAELAGSSRYSQTAEGLANPTEPAGQRLRTALEELAAGALDPFLVGGSPAATPRLGSRV